MGILSIFSRRRERKRHHKQRWISMDISLWCEYSEIEKIKRALSPYVKELGWNIYSWDDTKNLSQGFGKYGKKLLNNFRNIDLKDKKKSHVSINIYPGGKLSPEGYLKVKTKILSLAYIIDRDLVYDGDDHKAEENFKETIYVYMDKKEGRAFRKKDIIIRQTFGPLTIKYPLAKRSGFEKYNKEKAVEVFGRLLCEESN